MPIYEKVVNSPYDKDHPPKPKAKVPTDIPQKFQDEKSKVMAYDNQLKSMLPSDKNKLIDLQVFQPPQAKGSNPYSGKKPFLPIEPIALTTPYVPPQYQNYINNMMKDFYTPFIYKDYNIQIGAPNADHEKAFSLFEDMTVPQEYYTSYKTLRDRKNLTGFIRGNFISEKNGEDISFSGSGKSLNSRLNFLSINPFTSTGSPNPYKGMHHNLLLYTSCYPITKNENGRAICAKHSVGINIRVHGLPLKNFISQYNTSDGFRNYLRGTDSSQNYIISDFDDGKKEKSNDYDKFNYDTWREIYYYEFIKNTICGNKISPNFIQSYCYFQTVNPDIKFPNNKLTRADEKVEYSDNIVAAISVLTESPDYSVYGWGSNAQKNNSGVVAMTHSGYKLPVLWVNILQQIVISFYVMYKYKFAFREMAIDNNFFIKNVDSASGPYNIWQYNIRGINYYLPNFGNLLLVDTGFKNIKENQNIDKHKLLMNNLVKNNDDTNIKNIYTLLFDNMKSILDTDTFKSEIKNGLGGDIDKFIGVTDGDGIDIWNNIMTNIKRILDKYTKFFTDVDSESQKDIEDEFEKLFEEILLETLKENVHNRVGTQLRDTEMQYINKDYLIQPKKGDIIVYETSYDSYIFVLFIRSQDQNNYVCVTKDPNNGNFIVKDDIKKDLTSSYLESRVLKFDLKEGEPVANNEDIIIESYTIT